MVNINNVYLVMSTVALLHEIPEPRKIDIKSFEKLLSPPVNVVPIITGNTVINSQRDQIEILVSDGKTDIRELSGKTNFNSSKIGELIEYFIKEFNLIINTYGINFIIKIPNSNPKKWIVDNILSAKLAKKTGKKLIGGKCTISLKSGVKIWNIGFDADGKNVQLNFNASEKTDKTITSKKITDEINKQWGLLSEYLIEIGLLEVK